MQEKRRATTKDERAYRRKQILQAASDLYVENSFFEINMAIIAKQAGLAKGTLYLYFPTKESVFLGLQQSLLPAFFKGLRERFSHLGTPGNEPALTAALADWMEENPTLMRMFAINQVVLENNVQHVEIREYKLQLLGEVMKTGSLMENGLTYLQPGQGAKLLLTFYSCLVGFWQTAYPAEMVEEVIGNHPELQAFNIDFKKEMQTLMLYHLSGLRNKNYPTLKTIPPKEGKI